MRRPSSTFRKAPNLHSHPTPSSSRAGPPAEVQSYVGAVAGSIGVRGNKAKASEKAEFIPINEHFKRDFNAVNTTPIGLAAAPVIDGPTGGADNIPNLKSQEVLWTTGSCCGISVENSQLSGCIKQRYYKYLATPTIYSSALQPYLRIHTPLLSHPYLNPL